MFGGREALVESVLFHIVRGIWGYLKACWLPLIGGLSNRQETSGWIENSPERLYITGIPEEKLGIPWMDGLYI